MINIIVCYNLLLNVYSIPLNNIIINHNQEIKTRKWKVNIRISNIHIIIKFRFNFTEVRKLYSEIPKEPITLT